MAEFGVPPSTLLLWLGLMLGAGAAAGLLAGLLGVGGGIVIVPLLYHLLTLVGIEEAVRMHVAVATSLLVIVPTAFVSSRSHAKRGAVDGRLLRTWGPAILVGVLLGTTVAGHVGGRTLTAVFAVVALLVAANFIFRSRATTLVDGFPNAAVKAGLGIVVGTFSAMMGIGGGTLSVPILTAFGYEARRAVGTAAAIGLIIAIPGAIGFILSGLGEPGRPPFSLGFANLLGAAIIVPMTILTAPWGARIAHAIPQRALKIAFGVFLALTSARMFYDLATM